MFFDRALPKHLRISQALLARNWPSEITFFTFQWRYIYQIQNDQPDDNWPEYQTIWFSSEYKYVKYISKFVKFADHTIQLQYSWMRWWLTIPAQPGFICVSFLVRILKFHRVAKRHLILRWWGTIHFDIFINEQGYLVNPQAFFANI